MALSTAEKQKNYRERKKIQTGRLDILINPEELQWLLLSASDRGMTQAEFFRSLLPDNISY